MTRPESYKEIEIPTNVCGNCKHLGIVFNATFCKLNAANRGDWKYIQNNKVELTGTCEEFKEK